MAEKLTLYEQGQVIAAAVRLHTHREGTPPTPEEIGETIGLHVEKVHHTLNKMEELGAVKVLTGAFGTKVMLADHLAIEELEGRDATPCIDDEVAAFKAAQAKKAEELAKRFDKDFVDPEKQDLKADLNAKISDPSKLKKADNPLDAMFKKKK